MQMVAELRRLSQDVLPSLDAGNANSAVPDAKLLAFAKSKKRIALTHNRRASNTPSPPSSNRLGRYIAPAASGSAKPGEPVRFLAFIVAPKASLVVLPA